MQLEALQLKTAGESGEQQLDLKDLQITLNSEIASTAHANNRSGLLSLFPLHLKSDLSSTLTANAALNSPDQQLHGDLAHQLKLHYQQQLASPEALFNHLSISSEQQLTLAKLLLQQQTEETQQQAEISGVTLTLNNRLQREAATSPLQLANELQFHATAVQLNSHSTHSDNHRFSLALQPKLSLALHSEIAAAELLLAPDPDKRLAATLLTTGSGNLSLQSEIDHFSAAVGVATAMQHFSFTKQQLSIAAEYRQQQLTFSQTADWQDIGSDQLAAPLDFKFTWQGQAALQTAPPQLQSRFSSHGTFTLGTLALKEAYSGLTLKSDGKFTLNGDYHQNNPAHPLTLQFSKEMVIENLALPTAKIHAKRITLEHQGAFSADHYQLNSHFEIKPLQLPELTRPVELTLHLQSSGDIDFKQNQLELTSLLEQQPLLALQLRSDNRPGALQLQPQIELQLPRTLANLHPDAALLDKTGEITLKSSSDLTLHHGATAIESADFTTFNHWPKTLHQQSQLQLAQLSPQPILQLQLSASDQPQQFKLDGTISVAASPDFSRHFSQLEPLKLIGANDAEIDLNSELQHPASDLTTLLQQIRSTTPFALPEKVTAKVKLTTRISQ
ncbi:MAG: hypothetical protein HQL49_11250, partial [Gammaproteobacteria bacterium]|nr:hypothetical protein [Gammaproteobacteria bacterium]